MSATQPTHSIHDPSVLYMALELGQANWKLGFTVAMAQKPRLREVPAQCLTALAEEIRQAKERFGLPSQATVVSCYEAGRDGFWLHRALLAAGVENRVVDSSSIEVNRRRRRAKTDRLDAEQLLKLLIRSHQGERKVWSEVHVPTEEQETPGSYTASCSSSKRSRRLTSIASRDCWPVGAWSCRSTDASRNDWKPREPGTSNPCQRTCVPASSGNSPACNCSTDRFDTWRKSAYVG